MRINTELLMAATSGRGQLPFLLSVSLCGAHSVVTLIQTRSSLACPKDSGVCVCARGVCECVCEVLCVADSARHACSRHLGGPVCTLQTSRCFFLSVADFQEPGVSQHERGRPRQETGGELAPFPSLSDTKRALNRAAQCGRYLAASQWLLHRPAACWSGLRPAGQPLSGGVPR